MKKADRAHILAKTNGRCAYCGISLEGIKWHADHLKPIQRESKYVRGKGFKPTGKIFNPENDTLENMLASCPSCNLEKTANSLEEFRTGLEKKIEVLNNNNTYRHAKRYGLLAETPKKNEEVFACIISILNVRY